MGKVVKISVVDGAGVGVGGQAVQAGGFDLTTTSAGLTQALLDDGRTVITINGVKAYEGDVEGLKSLEVFTISGERKG